jgi:hypothetical protein
MFVENMESSDIAKQDSNDKQNSKIQKFKKSVTWSDVVCKCQHTSLPFTSTT